MVKSDLSWQRYSYIINLSIFIHILHIQINNIIVSIENMKCRHDFFLVYRNDERVMKFIGEPESYKDHFENYPIEKIGINNFV